MASSTSDDTNFFFEDSAQDVVSNKKVQSRDLKSVRLIGKGSSGIVYETTWKGESYARKDFLRVPSDIFEREAAVIVGLGDHPNVVRTFCWTVDDASCSLVSELMDDDLLTLMRRRKQSLELGPSDGSQMSYLIDLQKFIEERKNASVIATSEAAAALPTYPFSMREALQVIVQIAEGMKFLHDKGVVHGDLKPKNILVTLGERAVADTLDQNVVNFDVKVADFGLVRTKMKSRTLVSSQILTGKDPYLGLGLNDLVREIPLGLRPELPTTHTCPPRLRDLIQRCWSEKNRRPRFFSILSNLKAFLSQADPPPQPYLSDFHPLVDIKEKTRTELPLELTNIPVEKGNQEVDIPKGHEESLIKAIQGESNVNMSDYLKKAQVLAAELPSGDKIKLYKRLCLCLEEKLQETLKSVEPYRRLVQFREVLDELHLVDQRVKSFADDCCYEDHGINVVLAAIKVTTHKQRFYKYHVDLAWFMSLVARLEGQCAPIEEFNSEDMIRLVMQDTSVSSLIAEDERELKDDLERWIAKPGEHQAICWTLLLRLGSRVRDTMPDDLGAPPFTSLIGKRECEILATDSFGKVYGIEWNKKGFAVKVIESVADTEVEIWEDCCHPHIVNLLLARKEDSSQYLMMERLSMDLGTYIWKRSRRDINRKDIFIHFTPREIIDMVSQICDGMVYLSEEKNVSHRDMKPQNILVKEGDVLELQVAGFELAKVRQEPEENPPEYGTSRYRAPEMTQIGREKIKGKSSIKADVYSFALTCSMIWTGSQPFPDCYSPYEIYALVKGGKRPDLPKNCPLELSSLMQRCWHAEPAERPPFSEIYKQLRNIKANLLTGGIYNPPIPPPPLRPPPKGGRPLRILVLGDWKLVKTIRDICVDGTPTYDQVKEHVNLTRSGSSSPPMCLYYNITEGSANSFTDIRAFVKARNNMWHPKQVLKLWDRGKHHGWPRLATAGLVPELYLEAAHGVVCLSDRV